VSARGLTGLTGSARVSGVAVTQCRFRTFSAAPERLNKQAGEGGKGFDDTYVNDFSLSLARGVVATRIALSLALV